METAIDKFLGIWENQAGNRLTIERVCNQSAYVSSICCATGQPVSRPFHGGLPSLRMPAVLIDYGASLEVELGDIEKGFTLDLDYEYPFSSDTKKPGRLVPSVSRYAPDGFLDEYCNLFGPLQPYSKVSAEQKGEPDGKKRRR